MEDGILSTCSKYSIVNHIFYFEVKEKVLK